MKISDWNFTAEDDSAAAEVVLKVDAARHSPDLPTDSGGVTIDGPGTQDRDDAIQMDFYGRWFVLHAYIANPTAFIPSGHRLDVEAQKRGSTLYLAEGSLPMFPRLTENALSLNEGRPNPALKITTVFDKEKSAPVFISIMQCLLTPENKTYGQFSRAIGRKDERFAAWNQGGYWLKGVREKGSSYAVLPHYDPESGILRLEDGRVEYVTREEFNAHSLVQEAMIRTNISCAEVLQRCFGEGVFRAQSRPDVRARYDNKATRHASLGLPRYGHFTSPLRRYPDIIGHRYLSQLGPNFELDCTVPSQTIYLPPYNKGEIKIKLDALNRQMNLVRLLSKNEIDIESIQQLREILPEEATEKFRELNPLNFSNLLKAAARYDEIDTALTQEIVARIGGMGGPQNAYALALPRDAINIFCYSSQHTVENKSLWNEIQASMLEYLASNPQKLDEVFTEFIIKIGGKFDIKQAVLFAGPQQKENDSASQRPVASVIVADIDGSEVTTREFAIGFSDRTSVTRAKLEFLKSYASHTLIRSADARLPEVNEKYIADTLFIESKDEIARELREKGYRIFTETIPFAASKSSSTPRGYKFEMKLMKDGKPVISVIVKRDTKQDAEKIGYEVAIQELRSKCLIDNHPSAQHALDTFTGQIESNTGINFGNRIVVASRHAAVHDISAWQSFMELIGTGQFHLTSARKAILISIKKPSGSNEELLGKMKTAIEQIFPKITIVGNGSSVTVQQPPPELQHFCRQEMAR